MNRLIQHIRFLLLEHDFVVVPDLGGFVVNKEDASWREDEDILRRPRCWVSYNTALFHNDGLLTQLYVKTLHVSFVEAEKIIKEDVKALKSELHINNVFLGEWGFLYINNKDLICFRSLTENYMRPHLIGLENISLTTLEDIRDTEAKEQMRTKRFSFGRTIAVTVASVAVAALLFSISTPISEQKENNMQYAGFFSEKVLASDLLPEKDLAIVENETDSAIVSANEIVNKNTQDADNYFLIVGTFHSFNTAKDVLFDFRKKGFATSGILENGNVKRVFVASFSKKNLAAGYRSKFVLENRANDDAWVYGLKATDKILK